MTASRLAMSAVECPDWVGHCQSRASALRSLNLGDSFPAVRSLNLLSLADPLLAVAPTAWMSAVQREEPVASACFPAAQFDESWGRSAAVGVGRQPTQSRSCGGKPPRLYAAIGLDVRRAFVSPTRAVIHFPTGCHRSSHALLRRLGQRVLVDLAVLHDDDEVAARVLDQPDVFERVAVDEKEIGERSFLNYADSTGIWVARPR
jgi:hypothetical protein